VYCVIFRKESKNKVINIFFTLLNFKYKLAFKDKTLIISTYLISLMKISKRLKMKYLMTKQKCSFDFNTLTTLLNINL